jgi:hypothetical protein
MRILNDMALVDGVMDSTDTIYSDWIWLGHAAGACIQAVWTGTPEGALKLQCSVDPKTLSPGESFPTLSNPEDIADSSYTITGAAGSYTWNVDAVFYPWIRVVYTNTSSTGTLNVRYNTKGF